MDYENKYKEAFERARAEYGGATDYVRGILAGIFPELAESEDERIRKELIEQVGYILPDKEEYDDEGNVLPAYHKRIERYRAYLEKQKEQKPAEWSEDDENKMTDAIYFLESAKIHYADPSEIDKTIAWFKSLRPGDQDCKGPIGKI